MNRAAIVFSLLVFSSAIRSNADSIRTYFNHNSKTSYTDPYYHRNRSGDNLEDVLLRTIESAQHSISIAIYELDLPKVGQALVRKKNEGVSIRIILENINSKIWHKLTPEEIAKLNEHDLGKYQEFINFADTNHDGEVNADELAASSALAILKAGGVQWVDDTSDGSKGSGLMHHKFMIVDNAVLITGSANFTRSCIHGDSNRPRSMGNANSLLRIENQELISLFKDEFEEMWIGHHFGLKKTYRGPQTVLLNGSKVTVQFSPTSKKLGWDSSVNGLIARQFVDARESGKQALFVFSEQQIVDEMQKAHERGVKNRTIIDPSFATRYYSELLDIFGLQMRNPKCAYETGNNPWVHSSLESGFTVLDEGDKLHHKFGLIDDRKVIVGSHNWSAAANQQNDEALLVIDDSNTAASYAAEFEGLYQRSIIGPQPWLLKKIATLEAGCSAKTIAP